MIRSYLKKQASRQIETSRVGSTKVGRAALEMMDEEESEVETYENLALVTHEMRHSYFRRRMILIAISVNLISWLAVFFLPGVVGRLSLVAGLVFSKGGILLVLPACAATLIGNYAIFRIWFPELESNTGSSSDVMSSFQQQSDSLRTWRVWVVSCGLAGVDGILLFIAYMYVSGEWQAFAR